jgi:hypothetical protein
MGRGLGWGTYENKSSVSVSATSAVNPRLLLFLHNKNAQDCHPKTDAIKAVRKNPVFAK